MFLDFRESVADWTFALLYLTALFGGGWLDNSQGFLTGAALCALPAFAAWILSFRRLQAMSGTPTSRIVSAAQGYVELVGRGLSPPDFRVVSKLTGLPCVWFRYRIEERTSDNKWKHVESGRSTESFLLDDGTGVCLVDPEGAEVLPQRKDVWTQGAYRYTEWLILPDKKIYVIGAFRTLGGHNLQLDEKQDMGELLAQWKRDQPKLIERFDLDRDGQLGEQEWRLARAQARREVRKQHVELRSQPGTHVVQRPENGRLFLISDRDPMSLQRRYQIWTRLHLVVFLAAVSMAARLAVSL